MEDCIFCKIVSGEAPSTIEGQNDHAIAFRNIQPVADVHILVIPQKHIETFLDIEEAEVVIHMTKLAQEVIAKNGIEGGYKLAFNGGKYQKVPHLHLHILGGEMKDKSDILNQT